MIPASDNRFVEPDSEVSLFDSEQSYQHPPPPTPPLLDYRSKRLRNGVLFTVVSIIIILTVTLSYFLTRKTDNRYQQTPETPSTYQLPPQASILGTSNQQIGLQSLMSTIAQISAQEDTTDYQRMTAAAAAGGFTVRHESLLPMDRSNYYLCMLKFTGYQQELVKMRNLGQFGELDTVRYRSVIRRSSCDPTATDNTDIEWTIRLSIVDNLTGRVEIWSVDDGGNFERMSVDILHDVDVDYPMGKMVMHFQSRSLQSGQWNYRGQLWTDRSPAQIDVGSSNSTYDIRTFYRQSLQAGASYDWSLVARVQLTETGGSNGQSRTWRQLTLAECNPFVPGNARSYYYQMLWDSANVIVRRSDNEELVDGQQTCYSRQQTLTNVNNYGLFDPISEQRVEWTESMQIGQWGVNMDNIAPDPGSGVNVMEEDGWLVNRTAGVLLRVYFYVLPYGRIDPLDEWLIANHQPQQLEVVYQSGRSGPVTATGGVDLVLRLQANSNQWLVTGLSTGINIYYLVTERQITPGEGLLRRRLVDQQCQYYLTPLPEIQVTCELQAVNRLGQWNVTDQPDCTLVNMEPSGSCSLVNLEIDGRRYRYQIDSIHRNNLVTSDATGELAGIQPARRLPYIHQAGNAIDQDDGSHDDKWFLLNWYGGGLNMMPVQVASNDDDPDDTHKELYPLLSLKAGVMLTDDEGRQYKLAPLTGTQNLRRVDAGQCSSIVDGQPAGIKRPVLEDLSYPVNHDEAKPTGVDVWYRDGVSVI